MQSNAALEAGLLHARIFLLAIWDNALEIGRAQIDCISVGLFKSHVESDPSEVGTGPECGADFGGSAPFDFFC
jgi:hypothetical protein